MIIFPGGERLKWNFRRGGGSILGADFGKSRGGRGYTKNPFRGGGYGYFLEPHNITCGMCDRNLATEYCIPVHTKGWHTY